MFSQEKYDTIFENIFKINTNMNIYDPLAEIEKQLDEQLSHTKTKKQKIKISRAKVIFSTHQKTTFEKFLSVSRFVTTYILLSGMIFAVMMAAMNFNAYSARIVHWFNPEAHAEESQKIAEVIEHSSTEIAGAKNTTETLENRAIIEEKIAEKNPEMVYARHYSADNLLSNIPLQSAEKASFSVNPQENRIIIPKLGKNIPLVDVDHDANTPYEKMHEVFMEELKK